MSKTKSRRFLRFSIRDRFEHWLLVFSFSLLALTGLTQKFSEFAASKSIIDLLGGIETVRLIHRFGAILLMLEMVYHLGVLSYRFVVERTRLSMLPSLQDVRDALRSLQYSLGLKKSGPEFERYSYEEKFEYWAVIWGLAIMILTGFMLWNPIATTNFLPGQYIPAAKSAHGNEALLAVLAIIIWHFYNVLVRHVNKSMYTGYLSREEMLEYHPKELAEIEAGTARAKVQDSELDRRRRTFLPIFMVVSAAMLVGIFLFVTFEKSALDTVDPVEQLVIFSPLEPTATPSASVVPSQADENGLQGNPALEMMWPSSAHTNKNAEAFRHWDDEGQVDASCSICHSSEGLPYYLATGSTIAQPISNGLFCDTCHNDTAAYTVHDVASVVFPSGASIDSEEASSNLCMSCHSGLASGAKLAESLSGLDDDVVDESLQFVEIHLPAPGATIFGSEASGAYQYAGNVYDGLNQHARDFSSCVNCHDSHQLEVSIENCAECHDSVGSSEDLTTIRFSRVDFDGDGNIDEGIAKEIGSLRGLLFSSIQDYALLRAEKGLVYDAQLAPYFFVDTNENGIADPGELNTLNRYDNWTPRLLRAAFNYHFSIIDSGGFAHNPTYVIQILFDSLQNLGADVSSLTRP